jgi:carbamoyltransferase
MNILGINTGSGASICLFEGDRITLAIEEERLARIKGKGGFPIHSLNYIREHHREALENIDFVAVCDLVDSIVEKDELIRRYEIRFKGEPAPTTETGKLKAAVSPFVPEGVKALVRKPKPDLNLQKMIQEHFSDIDIPDEKFVRLNHHDCHASAAYFGLAKEPTKSYLVMTLDGGGDSECGSISIGKDRKLERITSIPAGHSIGNIYSNVTYLLGLTPHEHEYKIMGLEPYVPEKYRKQALEIFSRYLKLSENGKGLVFERTTEKNTNWIGTQLAEDLKYMRFDSISAGLQEFTENIVLQWVRNAIEKTGIKDILLSGGVFMNVKVNKLIAEMPEVNSVDVFPSCGDESNSIGIAFNTYAEKNDGKMPVFDRCTLGPEPSFDMAEAKEKYADQCTFETMDNPAKTIARLLADGKVVARCNGPMEVGARALGNRSLLADPSNADVVERINFVIKQRDFWMPFAPAMLAEDAREYIVVPEAMPDGISPYMMFAFETTERRGEMAAALHRADKTARAQIVSKETYPGFHEVISEFKEITGRSVVLNTSFNLHGHPIVMGTCESIDILLQTDLEYLAVDDQLICKRS